MRLTTTLLILAALASPLHAQSLWAKAKKKGPTKDWIEDNTAAHVGDILTIVIRERHKVKNEDKLDRTTSTTLSARLESFRIKSDAFSVLPDLDVRSSRSHKGNAKQERDSDVEGRIAVTVVDELPNGNLVVSGQRSVVVDDVNKTLKISGIVRKLDIAADNTIQSNQVAEAKVAIMGTGKHRETVTRGPIGKVVETLWWLVWPF